MALAPRVVLVHRASELDELTARHSTRGQVEFFLKQRGRTLEQTEQAHVQAADALHAIASAIPADWRRADVERSDLPQFLFTPEDIVAVIGRDGLVANVAKYVHGQAVVGFNPFPTSNAGVLTQWDPLAAGALLPSIAAGKAHISPRAMVQAVSDDQQEISALNDLYVGHAQHQSAVYELRVPHGEVEHQSSSGLVVGTGTGSTGWLASLSQAGGVTGPLPRVESLDLAWFVREAWPSPFTGTAFTHGTLAPGQQLQLTVKSDALVTFGDGIESDRMQLAYGQSVVVSAAQRRLNLVTAH